MKKFYEKNELWFALILIIIYSVGQSFANELNKAIGVGYSANAIFNVFLAAFLLWFIFKNGLKNRYKFQKPTSPAIKFLWFIPLVIIASLNLWNGIAMKYEPAALTCYLIYMFCVGIVEEVLFRGLLFEAIAKDNIKLAIVIASVTFGLGHVINAFNGNNESVFETVCQVIGAIIIGFLFVVIYYRGGSIIPCILTHSAIDMASAFANPEGISFKEDMIWFAIRIAIFVAYTVVLLITLPKEQERGTETK